MFLTSESHDSLLERAAPTVDRLTHQLTDRAHRVAGGTRAYVHEAPLKSLVIAAAAGAILVTLLAVLGGSRRDR